MKLLKALIRKGWQLFFFCVRLKNVPENAPHLSYAGVCLRDDQPTRGGNVKLRLLHEKFPEQRAMFNILYLVSGGVTVRAEAWADYCLSHGKKLVWNQNGVAYPAWAPLDHERLNARMKRFLHRASFVVYQSKFCKESADRFLGKFMGASAVVYNAVDTHLFIPRERFVPKYGKEQLRLLTMGSHENAGRVTSALDVVAILKKMGVDACLAIVGRLAWPNAAKEIADRIRSLNIESAVTIAGPYCQENAPDIYRSADMFLHLNHADACPSVVIEAMACGLPVVALDSGGTPELLGEDGGVKVSVPHNLDSMYSPSPDDVAKAVMLLAKDLSSYSEKARRRAVAYFDKASWLKQHEAIFEHVLRSV